MLKSVKSGQIYSEFANLFTYSKKNNSESYFQLVCAVGPNIKNHPAFE
jgi:hypothetical protein